MNRIKDYSVFAICFVGLGYMVLWPITSTDLGGRLFGAALFCGDAAPGVLDFFCRSALPLQLPANLHVLGFSSALFVVVRLLLRTLRRSLHVADTPALDISALTICLPDLVPPPRRKPPRPLPKVKARTHFGLRGMRR